MSLSNVITDAGEHMHVANELAAERIAQGRGCLFDAVVVDGVIGTVLGAGANLVPSSNLATVRAEVVARSMAQFFEKASNLSDLAQEPTLIVRRAPCAMCLGVLIWSRIRHVEFLPAVPTSKSSTVSTEAPSPTTGLSGSNAAESPSPRAAERRRRVVLRVTEVGPIQFKLSAQLRRHAVAESVEESV